MLLKQFHLSKGYVTGTLCLTDRHLIFIEPTGAQETWVRMGLGLEWGHDLMHKVMTHSVNSKSWSGHIIVRAWIWFLLFLLFVPVTGCSGNW